MFPIWYILHCEKGKERRAAELLKQRYGCWEKEDIFLITFEKMKRYEGSWHFQEAPLLGGWVFAQADNQKRLEEAAREAAAFQVCGDGEYSRALLETEKNFLLEVGGKAHRIGMSKGYIKDGVPFVTEGPLCGKEWRIQKIDRHKRMARIDSPLNCHQKQGLWIGLEITAKN